MKFVSQHKIKKLPTTKSRSNSLGAETTGKKQEKEDNSSSGGLSSSNGSGGNSNSGGEHKTAINLHKHCKSWRKD